MYQVAPHAGAWIETNKAATRNEPAPVAPHAGAWIETRILTFASILLTVAPHAGAWIETCFAQPPHVTARMSRPTRARGLKLILGDYVTVFQWSRPTRARGLKHSVSTNVVLR